MLAYLRLGEQQNCLAAHTSHSCLFPITDAGVHRLPDGSRLAIEEMLAYLPSDPSNLACRWLLNLAYMTLGEYPDGVPPAFLIAPEAFASEYPLPGSNPPSYPGLIGHVPQSALPNRMLALPGILC